MYGTDYWGTLVLTKQQVYDMSRFNNAARRYGFEELDHERLEGLLGGLSTIFSTLSLGCASTALGIASAIAACGAAIVNSEKETLERALLAGEDYLEDLYAQMTQANATKVEVRVPLIDYPNEGIRFVFGEGEVQRALIGEDWIPFG